MATAKNQSKTRQRVEDNLTKEAIKQRFDERSFQRGQDYFESGAIFDCRRERGLLKARCEGQSADSYRVSARIADGQVTEAECHCPMGSGGQCKHVAAMLLTWIHTPDQFQESAPLEERLSECSKPRLVELIQQMIDREPDLESWVELALTTTKPSRKAKVVKPDAYRRQTVSALSNAGYGRQAEREVTAALESIKKIGDQFGSQKHVEAAAAVYRGILDGYLSKYEPHDDETGNVGSVAGECLAALGECLPQFTEDSEARKSALRTLFDVLRFDLNFGGIGLSDDVPDILDKQTTAGERATIATWIREELSDDQDSNSNWRRHTWGRLLLDFEEELKDDDAFLKHCREFGLNVNLVNRLLERGRLEEALEEIRSSSDYDLMALADRLIAHKHVDLAHSLVRERLSATADGPNHWQLRDWIKRFYQAHENWKPLLELKVAEFHLRPSLPGYQGIRKIAKTLQTWDTLQPTLLSSIPRDSNELIRIYLDEGEINQAIELWESRPAERRVQVVAWDRIDLEVAKAAEQSHPETALKIYRNEVESLIAIRGRQNYQDACEYLTKIRQLLTKSGPTNDWDTYMTRLRDRHRSLRALLEELKNARL